MFLCVLGLLDLLLEGSTYHMDALRISNYLHSSTEGKLFFDNLVL